MDLNGTILLNTMIPYLLTILNPITKVSPRTLSTSLARGRNSCSARTLSAGPKLSDARDQRQDQAAESIGTSHRAKIVVR